jgi:hypothetical protein
MGSIRRELFEPRTASADSDSLRASTPAASREPWRATHTRSVAWCRSRRPVQSSVAIMDGGGDDNLYRATDDDVAVTISLLSACG